METKSYLGGASVHARLTKSGPVQNNWLGFSLSFCIVHFLSLSFRVFIPLEMLI